VPSHPVELCGIPLPELYLATPQEHIGQQPHLSLGDCRLEKRGKFNLKAYLR